MSIAILGIKSNNDDKVITIENGILKYIDDVTSEFDSIEDFKNSAYYNDKIKTYKSSNRSNDKLVLTYIKNNKEKIELTPIFGEEDPIRIRTSSLENCKSETERARKLLLNSKNQIFLTSFLLSKTLNPTTVSTVKMTIEEYKKAKKEGYQVSAQDGEYRIPIKEVLRYRLEHKKLGFMRLLVEDTLEVWKKNMLSLKDEELYFYSREMRMLINEYNYRKIPRKVVCNLQFNNKNIKANQKLNKRNNFTIGSMLLPSKIKVLEERNAA